LHVLHIWLSSIFATNFLSNTTINHNIFEKIRANTDKLQ
jgi:hypothetical protein